LFYSDRVTPNALFDYLSSLTIHDIKISVMLWGAPGVGKSSVVAQVAKARNLEFIDVRLSQLAPTDLRGLPVPVANTDSDGGISRWYPPEFLPQSGQGVLFLDELNMAPPTMQGMAQQLILDRRVGSYVLPEGWFVWAAGNRKEDRASVFDMPAPLANRFLHLEVESDLESFKRYGLERNLHEQILAFLSFRPNLLHAMDSKHPAWASPRSWEMASILMKAGLAIAPVVGAGAQAEFEAFCEVYAALPALERILEGNFEGAEFPAEPSARYATVIGLISRVENGEQAFHAMRWLSSVAGHEWLNLFAVDCFPKLRTRGQLGAFTTLALEDARIQGFLKEFRTLVGI
jgi:AAA domain (dynein-related subfamily)